MIGRESLKQRHDPVELLCKFFGTDRRQRRGILMFGHEFFQILVGLLIDHVILRTKREACETFDQMRMRDLP